MGNNIDLSEPLRRITSARKRGDSALKKAEAASDPDGVPDVNPVGHNDTSAEALSPIDGIEVSNITRRPANRTDLQDALGAVLGRKQPRAK
jgi:hypothetical protein